MKAAKKLFRVLVTVASLSWIGAFFFTRNTSTTIICSVIALILFPLLCLEVRGSKLC
jgi:hypothetical protein